MIRIIFIWFFALMLGMNNPALSQHFLYNAHYYDYLNKGQKELDNARYNEAILTFKNAIQINSRYPEAYNGLGLAYQYQGDRVQALYYYKMCISKNPKFVQGYINRAVMLADTMQNYDEALKDVKIAIALRPSSFLYSAQGRLNVMKNQFKEAIKSYNAAIKLEPLNPEAFSGRGRAFQSDGKTAQAEADYKSALELDPKNLVAKLGMAALYLDKKDPLMALKYIDNLLSTHSKFVDVLYLKGIAQAQREEYSEAIKTLLEVCRLLPELADAKYALGNLYLKKGENDKAIDAFKSCIEIKPDVSDGYIQVMAPLVLEHRFKEVSKIYSDYKQRNLKLVIDKVVVSFYDYFMKAGSVELLSGNYVSALKNANRAIELYNIEVKDKSHFGFAEGYVLQGYLLDKLGRKSEALQAYRAAFETAGDNPALIREINALENPVVSETIIAKDNAGAAGVPILPVEEKNAKFYAIIIAQTEYQDKTFTDLTFPSFDASRLKKVLMENYNFAARDITETGDTDSKTILDIISKRCLAMKNDDNLLIFYSGHGAAEVNANRKKDIYWVPALAKSGEYASYVSMDEVYRHMGYGKARHIMVIADACYSGQWNAKRGIGTDIPTAVGNAYKNPSKTILTGGRGEVKDNNPLMKYFLQYLVSNKKKYITAGLIFKYLSSDALDPKDNSYYPRYRPMDDTSDAEGDFVFIRK